MKYKIVCGGIPMQMSRTKNDKYYATDAYLLFGNEPATLFDSVLEATRAVEISILYAMNHGYEKSWGICNMEHSVIPVAEPESV